MQDRIKEIKNEKHKDLVKNQNSYKKFKAKDKAEAVLGEFNTFTENETNMDKNPKKAFILRNHNIAQFYNEYKKEKQYLKYVTEEKNKQLALERKEQLENKK